MLHFFIIPIYFYLVLPTLVFPQEISNNNIVKYVVLFLQKQETKSVKIFFS